MGVPSYLSLSRHGVFYFRFPLPESFREAGRATDIKVSLRTRDRREALHLETSGNWGWCDCPDRDSLGVGKS
jgi:hypothetical protein